MAGHENDWNVRLGEFGLKVQPAQSGQPDVKDQAACDVRKLALQHFGRRTEHLNLQAHRFKKIGQRPVRRCIVGNSWSGYALFAGHPDVRRTGLGNFGGRAAIRSGPTWHDGGFPDQRCASFEATP
jgi:hypothetical protein